MRTKAPRCACAYTDLDARTGEREFFNKLAYNIGSKVYRSGVYIAYVSSRCESLKGMSERSELIPCI